MASLLAAHKYARLSAKKDLNVDEERKKQVKDLRDTEKYLWKELEEHYFSQSEEHILEALKYCQKPLEGLARITLQFKTAFAAKKREKNVLDFSDMEHFALEILMKKEGEDIIPSTAAKKICARYEEVMVDNSGQQSCTGNDH